MPQVTEVQQIVLIAMKDGKARTRHEVKRAANLTFLNSGTLRALSNLRLIDKDDTLDGPETWTITETGLARLKAER